MNELYFLKMSATCTFKVAGDGVLELKECGKEAVCSVIDEHEKIIGYLCREHADFYSECQRGI